MDNRVLCGRVSRLYRGPIHGTTALVLGDFDSLGFKSPDCFGSRIAPFAWRQCLATGRGVVAILMSAVIVGLAFIASVLVAITMTARLGGPL